MIPRGPIVSTADTHVCPCCGRGVRMTTSFTQSSSPKFFAHDNTTGGICPASGKTRVQAKGLGAA